MQRRGFFGACASIAALGKVPAALAKAVSAPVRRYDRVQLTDANGAPLSAARAHRVGLVHEVVASEQLAEATTALATELAANAPLAVRAFKKSIALAARHDAEQHHQAMNDVMVCVMTSADAREGLQAFLEKRSPQYVGR